MAVDLPPGPGWRALAAGEKPLDGVPEYADSTGLPYVREADEARARASAASSNFFNYTKAGPAKPNGKAHEPEPGSPEYDAQWAPSPEELAAAIQAKKDARSEIEAFPGWQKLLVTGPKGEIYKILANALVALRNAPAWQGVFGWNEFACRTEVLKQLPAGPARPVPHELTDVDITNTTDWLQQHGVQVGSKVAEEAIRAVADENRFHPVREYLAALVWDGTARLDMWLIDHLGAEDDELNRAVGGKWMIGLVARVMSPGCQFDTALICESPQGRGKSSAFRTLAEPWFTDRIPDLKDKDALQQLQGVWLLEWSELDSFRRADGSKIKAFVSARVDRFRPSYGRLAVDYPRQCGFAGTVNPSDTNGYLRDETGARRFWCVACAVDWEPGREVDIPALKASRDQLWAEALVRFEGGEPWHLDTLPLKEAQAEAAEERREDDPRERKVLQFVRTRGGNKFGAHMDEILGKDCLEIPIERWNRSLRTEIGIVLTNLKCIRKRLTTYDGDRDWFYFPQKSQTGGTNDP